MEHSLQGLDDYLFRVRNLSECLKCRFETDFELVRYLESLSIRNYYVSNYFATLKGFLLTTEALDLEGEVEFVVLVYLQDGKHSYLFWDKEYYESEKEARKRIETLLRYSPLYIHLSRNFLR